MITLRCEQATKPTTTDGAPLSPTEVFSDEGENLAVAEFCGRMVKSEKLIINFFTRVDLSI